MGMAARAESCWTTGERSENWDAPFGRGDPHRGQRLQRFRGHVARHDGQGAAAIRGLPGPERAADAGLRRPAGRSEPDGLPRLDRPARDRGQRGRAAAGPGTADQGGRVHPRLSRRGRPAAAAPQPDVLGRNGTFVGLRKYQSRVGAFNRFLREHAADRAGAGAARGEADRALAQRRAVDARPGRGRPGARRGPAPQQRLHLCRRSPRPAGAARLAHAAHEPARHRDGDPRRRQPAPHHPAQHDLRCAL